MNNIDELINAELTKHNDVQLTNLEQNNSIDSLNTLNHKYHAMSSIIQLSKEDRAILVNLQKDNLLDNKLLDNKLRDDKLLDNKLRDDKLRDDNLHEDNDKKISVTPDLPMKNEPVPKAQDHTKLFRAISTASAVVKGGETNLYFNKKTRKWDAAIPSDDEEGDTKISNESKLDNKPKGKPEQSNTHPHLHDEHLDLCADLETKVEALIKIEKIKFPTKENITDYLNDNHTPEQSMVITHQTFQTILAGLEETPGSYKKYVAYSFFQYAGQNLWFLYKEPLFALLVKIYFHHFIVDQRLVEFIPLYNVVFNDHLYDNTSDVTVFPKIIPKEFIDKKIAEYQDECKRIEYKRRAKRQPPKYEKGEIVGAKDKEGRWWMSRVLEVFQFMEHTAYYIEFLGWGDKFNEFITDGFRIQPFNPRRHLYYRPAWRIKERVEPSETKEDN